MKKLISIIRSNLPCKHYWVMQSSPRQLKSIVLNHLQLIDDVQQDAPDAENPEVQAQLADMYNQVEAYWPGIRNSLFITPRKRNEIRLTLKHIQKCLYPIMARQL